MIHRRFDTPMNSPDTHIRHKPKKYRTPNPMPSLQQIQDNLEHHCKYIELDLNMKALSVSFNNNDENNDEINEATPATIFHVKPSTATTKGILKHHRSCYDDCCPHPKKRSARIATIVDHADCTNDNDDDTNQASIGFVTKKVNFESEERMIFLASI
eukprot:PhF_6_TR22740/c0_g1_i2/m.32418